MVRSPYTWGVMPPNAQKYFLCYFFFFLESLYFNTQTVVFGIFGTMHFFCFLWDLTENISLIWRRSHAGEILGYWTDTGEYLHELAFYYILAKKLLVYFTSSSNLEWWYCILRQSRQYRQKSALLPILKYSTGVVKSK